MARRDSKGLGNAYVVIEGPELSGVATFPAKNNKSAGPVASAFAATINNAAREAAISETQQPAQIRAAQDALTQAQDRSELDTARAAFDRAVAALPLEQRTKPIGTTTLQIVAAPDPPSSKPAATSMRGASNSWLWLGTRSGVIAETAARNKRPTCGLHGESSIRAHE